MHHKTVFVDGLFDLVIVLFGHCRAAWALVSAWTCASEKISGERLLLCIRIEEKLLCCVKIGDRRLWVDGIV